MPKQIDLRLRGIKFEDAMRSLLNAPPPPTSKKAKAKNRGKSSNFKK